MDGEDNEESRVKLALTRATLAMAKELLIQFIQEAYLLQTTGKSDMDQLIRRAREFLHVEA